MAVKVMYGFLCRDLNILSLAVGTPGVLVGSRFSACFSFLQG